VTALLQKISRAARLGGPLWQPVEYVNETANRYWLPFIHTFLDLAAPWMHVEKRTIAYFNRRNAMKIKLFIGLALFATAFSAWAAAGCPLGCC
jgi:hypothetical protein